MDKKICVLLEAEEDGSLREIGYELLNEAASLSIELEAQVIGILLGKGSDNALSESKRYGIGKLHLYDTQFDPEDIATNDGKFRKLCEVIDAECPAAILLGENHTGVNLASFLAAFYDYKIVSNAQRITYRAGSIQVEKLAYNGRLLKSLKYPLDQKVAVLFRPGTLGIGNPVKKAASIILEDLDGRSEQSIASIHHDNVKRERTYQVELTDKITEADVVIGVGGGVGNAELMESIVTIAKRLNAAIGGTRIAVDKRIVPYDKQIGQTGKTIAPKVYIALGVSGAIQHAVGVRNSKFIVAVNKDKNAPIMKMADLACISDIEELVPVLRKKIDSLA